MTLPFPDDGGGAWTADAWAARGGIGVGVVTRRCAGMDSRGGGVFDSRGGGVFDSRGGGVCKEAEVVWLTRPSGVPAGGVTLAPAPTFILKLLLPR